MLHGKWMVLFTSCIALSALSQQNRSSIQIIESLVRSQHYDQALDAAKSALQEKPADFRIWTLQGIALSLKGDKHDALRSFEKALRLSPKYEPALKGEAELLYESRDPRATSVLKQILTADPGDNTAHEMLAILEAKQGDCEGANQHFLLSAEASDHPESLEAHGYCLLQTKQAEKAITVFERLRVLHPESTYAKYDLAVALVEAKQNDAALRVLEPMIAGSPTEPDVLSLASEAYDAAGNTPKAVSLLRQAIVLNPSNASYYVAFAGLCLDHDSFQVGIDMLNAGLKRISDDPSLYIARGLLYTQLAKYDQAEADFRRAEQVDSAQSLSSYAMGLTEIARNNPDKALAEVRSQLKAHPDSPQLHFLLAKLLWEQRLGTNAAASDEAKNAALRAVKLKPDMVEARDLLADIYIQAEQYDLAIQQSHASLQYSPADQSALYHLIISLRHSGPEGQSQINELVKQLSDLKQALRQQETERKRFKLVEAQPPVN
jgi:tetratricopeptide (TPR) repeat protein